jgi:hypothetical protein
MGGLSESERELLATFAEHADWCDYADKSDEGCTPDFGCGVWKFRARLEAAVEQIATAHAAAAVAAFKAEAVAAIEAERDDSSERLMEFEDGYSEGHANAADIVRDLNTT